MANQNSCTFRRIAYNAALKLCTILLFASGWRPEKNLAHYRTLTALPLMQVGAQHMHMNGDHKGAGARECECQLLVHLSDPPGSTPPRHCAAAEDG
jgi:hypothetical protein